MTTLASEQSGMLLSEQQEASKAAERAAVAEKEAAIARTAEESEGPSGGCDLKTGTVLVRQQSPKPPHFEVHNTHLP